MPNLDYKDKSNNRYHQPMVIASILSLGIVGKLTFNLDDQAYYIDAEIIGLSIYKIR